MPIQSDNTPNIITIEGWKGVNQQSKRSSIDDQELWWSENLYQIAAGNLRSMWGPSPPIYTAPAGLSIRRIFFGFYGNDLPQYGVPPPGRRGFMFLSDGSIDEVDLDTKAVTRIGGGQQLWNPVAPAYWADTVVWRPRWVGGVLGEVGGVLFGSPGGQQAGDVGGLVAWDGTNVYTTGMQAPNWLTYADVTATNWTTMPSGLPDIYTMEVYNSRLWVAGKDVISWSAPTNATDFSDVDGGGSIAYSGNKLVFAYTELAASSGYLYCFGDSSCDVISQPTVIGQGTPSSPITTVFQYNNADPQVGHRFPRPAGRWGRYLILYNGAGIWEMLGGDAQNISEKISNLHSTIDTSEFYPTFAVTTQMFGFRVLLCNARMTDPFGQTRSFLLMWNGNNWTVASQHYNLIEIGQYEDSSVIIPYGTDGTNLYQLFWRPDATLPKRLSTKSLRGTGLDQITIKTWKRVYMEVSDNTGTAIPTTPPPPSDSPLPQLEPHGVAITGTLTALGGTDGGAQDVSFELPVSMQAVPTKVDLPPNTVVQEIGQTMPTELSRTAVLAQPTSCHGIAAQLDLQSTSADFTLERVHLTFEQRTLWGA